MGIHTHLIRTADHLKVVHYKLFFLWFNCCEPTVAVTWECYEHCGCGLLNMLIFILNIWLSGYPETILPTLFVILTQVHI